MFKLSQLGIRRKIANDPYYRFQSFNEMAIAVELGIRIDVNQATIDDWLRLPGFSIHQARSLVQLVNMGVQLVCLEDVAAAINLAPQRLQPYAQILAFAYYDRLSSLSLVKVDLNTASISEFKSIPQVTTAFAEELILNRQQQGKFHNLIDLKSRLNLSSETISQLMHYLRF